MAWAISKSRAEFIGEWLFDDRKCGDRSLISGGRSPGGEEKNGRGGFIHRTEESGSGEEKNGGKV